MSDFTHRLSLTQIIEESMPELFPDPSLKQFGCETILADNQELWEYVRTQEVNQSHSGLIVKFAPDFILLSNTQPRNLYFVDVKHSTSPIWAASRLEKIRQLNNDFNLSIADIGVIAREALLSYRRYYPNSIVLMASPYNSKLLMAQFADRIRCLYCYRSSGQEYNCSSCPAKAGGFFDLERAVKSQGSQTPMTNVDLRSFEPADQFFEKIGVNINRNVCNELKKKIQSEELDFSTAPVNRIDPVKWSINQSGCSWVKYKIYSKQQTYYFHTDRNCSMLKGFSGELQIFDSSDEAKAAGKKYCCKYCMKK